jgi:RimJ/RimL family protein N-acetyltransferase
MIKINCDLLPLYISLLKQKAYCNIDNIVYSKNDTKFPNINSNFDIIIDKLREENELVRYNFDENLKNDQEKIRYFLKQKCKIYIALHKNQVAGRYVLTNISNFKPYKYLNEEIFSKCTYYIFFCKTYYPYEGNNIFKRLLIEICQDTKKNSEKIFISCSAKNIASQRAILGAGFQEIGVLKYNSVFNLFKEGMHLGSWP